MHMDPREERSGRRASVLAKKMSMSRDPGREKCAEDLCYGRIDTYSHGLKEEQCSYCSAMRWVYDRMRRVACPEKIEKVCRGRKFRVAEICGPRGEFNACVHLSTYVYQRMDNTQTRNE